MKNSSTKKPTVDAQRVKRAMLECAKLIGRRKKIRAGTLFEMLVEITNQQSNA